MTEDLEPEGDDAPLDELDPIEDAWLQQDAAVVERLARERLATHPDDPSTHAWLGLALWVSDRAPLGQQSLQKAFELIRAQEAKATSDEAKHELTWELHGIANRLVDTVSDDPDLALAAARFVVDGLRFDHAPSLRFMAEDLAVREGDAVRAAGLLKRALAIDALDPETHYLAARLFARIGKKPQVLSHLKKSLDNAAGTIAVRSLVRFEPDFDGFRKDAEFIELTDPFPTEPKLRAVYEALDAQDLPAVIAGCEALAEEAEPTLDVLYAWREALELRLDQPETEDDDAIASQLDQIQADVEALEEKDAPAPAWARFSGDA